MKTDTLKKHPLQFRNWKGEMTDAPKDLKHVVAKYDEGFIVWSRKGRHHQVRYGLQVKTFEDSIDAAQNFGCCVHHLEECNGKL